MRAIDVTWILDEYLLTSSLAAATYSGVPVTTVG